MRLEMKNYNMILIKRLQKYELYHQAKLVSMNTLLVKKYYLLTNQQKIIEQAKFTYSPLGKLLKNKKKTIGDQGKKQVNALKSLESLKPKELKPKEAKPIEYNDYFLIGLAEIQKNNQSINFNDLTYNFKGPELAPINFIRVKGPNYIFKSIHNSDTALEDVEKEQIKLESDLDRTK